MPHDPDLPPVFTRPEALAAGLSRHQIAQRVRSGRWMALRRHVYTMANVHSALSKRDRHSLAVVATLLTRGDDEVASHLSAAVVHDLPLPLGGPGAVTLTSGDLTVPTQRTARLVLQVATLPDADRATRVTSTAAGSWHVRVTTPARTVADNLRHLELPDAVALGDGALRRGLTTYDAVAAVLSRQSGWPYAGRGVRALPLLDPRRETWLESWSFIHLHQLGMALPEPQVAIRDRRGREIARVDGWFDEEAVALEADGREKYFLDGEAASLAVDLDAAADELRRRLARKMEEEKRREDDLLDLGAQLVRWGTAEMAQRPTAVLARVERARARGDRGSFRGRPVYAQPPPWLGPARRAAG